MLTLVLTRHGMTDRSTPEQHLGQHLDVSINAAGQQQATALGRRLSRVAFDRVVTSPLFRARETAELIVAANAGPGGTSPAGTGPAGGAIEADPRLREMDYGAWEGRTYEQINELDASFRREWELAPDRLACPGGESGDDVAGRVTAFLRDLLDEHRSWRARASFRAATSGWGAPASRPDRPVLAVGHASTNRILLSVALGVSIAGFRHRFVQDPVNLTVLRWDDDATPDQAELLVMNDRSHLRATPEAPWA